MSLPESLTALGVGLPHESIEQIIRDAVARALGPVETLSLVADAELERRRVRSFHRRLQRSHLGPAAPLADFDFQHPSRIDRLLVDQAFSLRFLDDGASVLFIGPVGLGKTHLARALVHAAIAAGHRALFVDAISALDDLRAAKASGRFGARLRHYLRPRLLCLDAIAYQHIDLEQLDLLYEIIRRRYDARRSLVITTALPFAQWPSLMPSTAATAALVDRLCHRAIVVHIDGDSFRRRHSAQPASTR